MEKHHWNEIAPADDDQFENIMEKYHGNEIAPDDADEIENISWE